MLIQSFSNSLTHSITLSFASTLHLYPILDLLVVKIPSHFRDEIRLGLQEALVNAVKHGNHLDPQKKILVQFSTIKRDFWWIIIDEGKGYSTPQTIHSMPESHQESGRGLCLLTTIFDEVQWSEQHRELRLCKRSRSPSIFFPPTPPLRWWSLSLNVGLTGR